MLMERPEGEEYWKLLAQELLGLIEGLLGEEPNKAIKCRQIALDMVDRAKRGEFA